MKYVNNNYVKVLSIIKSLFNTWHTYYSDITTIQGPSHDQYQEEL